MRLPGVVSGGHGVGYGGAQVQQDAGGGGGAATRPAAATGQGAS